MRVTTWAEYGLIVSLHLAKEGGESPARDLAERESLPADYVEQILLKLRRAGLVKSVRGAKGGYYLAREPQTITVRDVMEAAENRTFEVYCDAHRVNLVRCGPDGDCAIRPVWRELQRRIDEMLSSVTLADLMRSEVEVETLVSA
jgi:Rrf2 family iron-sulfur cluster assembly transcriptional regulator